MRKQTIRRIKKTERNVGRKQTEVRFEKNTCLCQRERVRGEEN